MRKEREISDKVSIYEWKCPLCKKKLVGLTDEQIKAKIEEHLNECKVVKAHEYRNELKKRGLSDKDIKIIADVLLYEKVVKSIKRLMKGG